MEILNLLLIGILAGQLAVAIPLIANEILELMIGPIFDWMAENTVSYAAAREAEAAAEEARRQLEMARERF